MAFFKDDSELIKKLEDEDVAHLTTLEDGMTAEIICGLLRDAGIPCMAKDRMMGGTVKVIAGFTTFGTDIFVARPRLDEAKELVDAYFNAPLVEDGETESDQ